MRNSIFALLAAAFLAGPCAIHAGTRYVNASNSFPASPYSSWANAATTIQAALDISVIGDLILVTNGVYAVGGRVMYGSMSNRVAITKAVTVQSVNGPAATTIQGNWDSTSTNGDTAIRCAYLASGAKLNGFTLTRGATRGMVGDWANEQGGGGVWCALTTAIVSNCVLTGNSAFDYGAGAVGGTLVSCVLSNNLALDSSVASGGGAYGSVLTNCTVRNNMSRYGAGASSATATRCTFSGNEAVSWGGAASFSTLGYCTISGNSVDYGGGGATYSCTVTNSTLSGNWVGAGNGGGAAYNGNLLNCVLSANYAFDCNGGGAAYADLKNCALIGNYASYGGGSYMSGLNNCTSTANWVNFEGGGDWGSALTNCVLYYNNAYMLGGSNWSGATLRYCCTIPLPPASAGCFTNAPLFVNADGGDLRLLFGSPCLNAGLNAAAPGPVDLDGNPRIVSGVVDLGAYEWQARPEFVNVQRPGPTGMPLQLVGETGRVVEIHVSSNFAQWFLLATRTNTTGQISYTDSGATNQPRRFYKAIQLP